MTKKEKTFSFENLPFWKEIRASWFANQSHCDVSSPSKRKPFTEKGIKFYDDWTGDIGFLRYYVFHIDNNYIAGEAKLHRKDKNKGFSPESCIIVAKPKNKKYKSEIEPKTVLSNLSESEPRINVTNNFIITDKKSDDFIKDLLNNLSVKELKKA